MRHRAPRNLFAPLRRLRPRRRVGALARPGLRMVCAVASVLAVLTGAMVAASELGGDDVTTGGPAGYADRTGTTDPSRSSVRTPTFETPDTPSALPTRQPADASEPAPKPDRERSPAPEDDEQRVTRDTSPVDLPSAKVSASVSTPDLPSPDTSSDRSRSSSSDGSSTDGGSGGGTTTPRDTTPPQTSIVSGPSLTGTSGLQDSEFVFDANESATFTCSLDGQAFRPCDSPQEYDSLTPGRHEFAVRATDEAGNVDPTPARRTWIASGLDH